MLQEFALERWLRAQEKRAKFAIGGSGVARGDLAPYLPADMDRAWATHPDDAVRAVKEAVARQYGVQADHVLPTAGASEADAAAILGLAGPGARVVVEKPAYHALLHPALAFGCKVERVERAKDHTLPIDALLDAVTRDTKLIVLARPNNPTGDVLSAKDLRALGDAAAEVGARVLVDEVFADATDMGVCAALLHPRIVSVNSLTKTLGFSHLRVGWVAGDREAIEAIDRAKAVLSVNNALLDLVIGARVLDDRPKILARTRATRAACANVLSEFLEGSKKLRGRVPEHGTTTVLALPPGVDDQRFANQLSRENGVVMPPGSYIEMFGHLRVGLVGDPAKLREGLGIAEALLS